MTLLQKQIEEFEAEILLSNDTQENEIIIEHNETIFSELKSLSQKLSKQFNLTEAIACFLNGESNEYLNIVNIIDSGYVLNDAKNLAPSEKLLEKIDNIINQFKEYIENWEVDNYKVQQQPVYLTPRDNLKQLISNLNEVNDQYWRSITDFVNRDVLVEIEILEQQRLTPQGSENYSKYNTLKSRLDNDFQSRDINYELTKRIKEDRLKLLELKERFDTSGLPRDVAKFLKEINGIGGIATLDLLSSEVLEWLSDKELLRQYKVVRR